MVELLIEHGFQTTNNEEFTKENLVISFDDERESIIVTFFCPEIGRLIWSETYYNKKNFVKYIKKNHKKLEVT